MRHARKAGVVLLSVAAAGMLIGLVPAQQIHRNGFETRQTGWVKGAADAPCREIVHDITDATARTGQYCEHLQVNAEQGAYIYYYYPTAKAPVGDELSVNLWLKANRPGMQLMARLVLPHERNPNNLDEPVTVQLRGDLYEEVGRWQRLQLRRPASLALKQQQIMRAQLHRDVDFTGAYLDQLILNLYAGPGLAEIWIDDLEIGPVDESSPFQTTSRPAGPVKLLGPGQTKALTRPAVVELDRGQLLVNGKRFFIRGIRHSDTPLKALRDAGLNTVWFDHLTSPALIEEAVNLGFWIVPSLPTTENDARLASADNLRQEISRFLERDAVLFWDLGGGLIQEQIPLVAQTAQVVHLADPQRPLGGDAWDGLGPYSLKLDLLGVHRWPLMTGLEIGQYRRWIYQRHFLTHEDTFTWTWVQTHLPDWYTSLVYKKPAAAGFDEPVGPQPEQIRLLTYAAISAGCRGIGFWSDRFLADTHQGRDRLLTLALLNQELRMLEPLLETADRPEMDDFGWVPTSNPEVRAAILRTNYGVLVLPIWVGAGAQFVPGQSAAANLTVTVPQVPVGMQAWEVSPAEVRCLRQERVVGGTKITIPEFSLTAAIVFTADNTPNGLVVRFQEQARQNCKLAAQWSHDLADEEISKVSRVQAELERLGHPLPDGKPLLEKAQQLARKCVEEYNTGNYKEAYANAQRAVRPLRIIMRAQWEEAIKELNKVAVASPYATSFYTLPRHWQFMELIHQGKPGSNILPNGDFELEPRQVSEGWTPQEITLDQVELTARRVSDGPQQGKQCLMLQVKPKNPTGPSIQALERTFLAINSPVVRVQPGTIVKISGWVRIPKAIEASTDGALLYDSIGGEPLAVRLKGPNKWQQFVLYREVPASGQVSVTTALTGIGVAYFDDVRIEPLLSSGATAQSGVR
jgi:hypothetical protein